MREYDIIITPDAMDDMMELRDYIANVLLSPITVLEYIRTVREKIAGLTQLPARYKLLDEEPWHSRGVRRITAKSFYVYYRIDEAAETVYVLNVIYAKRDQLCALAQKEKNIRQ